MPTELADSPEDLRRIAFDRVGAVAALFLTDGSLEEVKANRRSDRAAGGAFVTVVARDVQPGLMVVFEESDAASDTFDRLANLRPAGVRTSFDVDVQTAGDTSPAQVRVVAGIRGRGRPRAGDSDFQLVVVSVEKPVLAAIVKAFADRVDEGIPLLRPGQVLDWLRRVKIDVGETASGAPRALPGPEDPKTRVREKPSSPDSSPETESDPATFLGDALRQIDLWERRPPVGRAPENVRTQQDVLNQELAITIAGLPSTVDRTLTARLESARERLNRVLDIRAQLDAAGPGQIALSTLTALVLVPTLVAGVYGSNVAVPLEGDYRGFLAMLAFMVGAATCVFAAFRHLRYDATGLLRLGQLTNWKGAGAEGASPFLAISFPASLVLVWLAYAANGYLNPAAPTTQLALVALGAVSVGLLLYEWILEGSRTITSYRRYDLGGSDGDESGERRARDRVAAVPWGRLLLVFGGGAISAGATWLAMNL